MVEPVEAPPEELELEGADVGGFGFGSLSVSSCSCCCSRSSFPIARRRRSKLIWRGSSSISSTCRPTCAELPRTPARPPGPAVRVDPRVLRQGGADAARDARAQSAAASSARHAARGASRNSGQPQTAAAAPQNFLRPAGGASAARARKPQTQTPPPTNGLILPRMSSPGRALRSRPSKRCTGRRRRSSAQFGGPRPAGGGGYGGGGGGGGGARRRSRDAHADRGRGFQRLPGSRGRQREAELVLDHAGIGLPRRQGPRGSAISHHAQRRRARSGARADEQLGQGSAGSRRVFRDSGIFAL